MRVLGVLGEALGVRRGLGALGLAGLSIGTYGSPGKWWMQAHLEDEDGGGGGRREGPHCRDGVVRKLRCGRRGVLPRLQDGHLAIEVELRVKDPRAAAHDEGGYLVIEAEGEAVLGGAYFGRGALEASITEELDVAGSVKGMGAGGHHCQCCCYWKNLCCHGEGILYPTGGVEILRLGKWIPDSGFSGEALGKVLGASGSVWGICTQALQLSIVWTDVDLCW